MATYIDVHTMYGEPFYNGITKPRGSFLAFATHTYRERHARAEAAHISLAVFKQSTSSCQCVSVLQKKAARVVMGHLTNE